MMYGQISLLKIECQKHDWHVEFCHKKLGYRRATAGTFAFNLLYRKGTVFTRIDRARIILNFDFWWKYYSKVKIKNNTSSVYSASRLSFILLEKS